MRIRRGVGVGRNVRNLNVDVSYKAEQGGRSYRVVVSEKRSVGNVDVIVQKREEY
jgi:hypothetical protein